MIFSASRRDGKAHTVSLGDHGTNGLGASGSISTWTDLAYTFGSNDSCQSGKQQKDWCNEIKR